MVDALAESDLELLSRWRAGDNRAGSSLVKRHFAALHRFFAGKVQAHAEDLIQQTFEACIEAKDRFREESSFRAYLFGLARFQLYMYFRKSARSASVDFTTTSICDLAASPSTLFARRQEERLIHVALQQIPVEQQIALELTYWEGLSGPEIAIALGIPENTVYSRLRRAKELLRTVLAELAETREAEAAAAALMFGADPAEER
jgi:RNA polymerase sigma factor (sigma-70 family)